MPRWTFITSHGGVLAFIAEHGQITARDIAAALGITERTVHRIITDLETEGYLKRRRDGRVNRYTVNPELSIRRPERSDVAVGALLRTLLPGRRRRRNLALTTRRDTTD